MQAINAIITQLNQVILGKERQVSLALACLLAKGHLLLEDLPGMGKTTLAQALAGVFDLQFRRLQFTSDLLPSDVTGGNVLDLKSSQMTLLPGPVFTQLLLADELNRASPKAQSALLEAMEEGQVSIDGQSHALPEPFFVIATQNPQQQLGTHPLPESQLDRFLFCISLGYPDPKRERELLRPDHVSGRNHAVQPMASLSQLRQWQAQVQGQQLAEPVLDYIQALLAATRDPSQFRLGLSPRAGQALVRVAQAWSMLAGREFVVVDDVQQVFVALASHRLQPINSQSGAFAAQQLLQQVPSEPWAQ